MTTAPEHREKIFDMAHTVIHPQWLQPAVEGPEVVAVWGATGESATHHHRFWVSQQRASLVTTMTNGDRSPGEHLPKIRAANALQAGAIGQLAFTPDWTHFRPPHKLYPPVHQARQITIPRRRVFKPDEKSDKKSDKKSGKKSDNKPDKLKQPLHPNWLAGTVVTQRKPEDHYHPDGNEGISLSANMLDCKPSPMTLSLWATSGISCSQIGNDVPPKFAETLYRHLKKELLNTDEQELLDADEHELLGTDGKKTCPKVAVPQRYSYQAGLLQASFARLNLAWHLAHPDEEDNEESAGSEEADESEEDEESEEHDERAQDDESEEDEEGEEGEGGALKCRVVVLEKARAIRDGIG